MKKQHLPNKTFLTNFAMQIIFLIFLFVSNILPQIVINERVEINPIKPNFDGRKTTEGDGWWIGGCYFENYDSSEVDLTFTPSAIEPGETTIMTVDYDEDLHHFLERNITLEPNLGTLVRMPVGGYKYYAPTSIPGDTALVVKIHYEQFWWYCESFNKQIKDSGVSDNILECGCLDWQATHVNLRYGIDSIMIAWDSLDVKIEPDTIYPGDTAQVVVKKRLPDGTLVDFDSTQTYEVGMLDGCILGNIKTSSDSGYYVYNVTQPIYFIADTSADTTGAVMLRVGLVEQTSKPEKKNNQQKDIVASDCFYGWQSDSYDYVTVVKDNLLEIIYPTLLTIERITNVPEMPTVVCKARLKKYYSGTIKYEWKYIVQQSYQRKRVSNCTRVSKSEFQGVSYSLYGGEVTEWTVPFIVDSGYFWFEAVGYKNADIYGGCSTNYNYWYNNSNQEIFTGGSVSLTLTAKDFETGVVIAKIENQPFNKILGTNPDISMARSYANDDEISAIMQTESETHQFTYNLNGRNFPYGYGVLDYPYYGPPNGYGIMQVDIPATTERELWNWKANIDKGKIIYEKMKQNTIKYLKKWSTNYPDSIRIQSAFQRYNGGNGSVLYHFNKNKKEWVINNNIPKNREEVNYSTGTKITTNYQYGIYAWRRYQEINNHKGAK